MSEIKKLDGFDNIYAVSQLQRELSKLFKKSPKDNIEYNDWLQERLQDLDVSSSVNELIQASRAFELLDSPKVSGQYSLYSIRHPNFPGNPRIIFTEVKDSSGQLHLLLVAFKELHGRSSYREAIDTARKRIKSLE